MTYHCWQRLTLLVFFVICVPAGAVAAPLSLSQRNSTGLAAAPDETSGLTWVGGDQWLAVSDNANTVVELTVPWLGDGTINTGATVVGPTHMLGGPVRDYEGIAFTPALSGALFVSEEGTPAVRQFDATSFAETGNSPLPTPSVFLDHTRTNRGFESLTVRADGAEAWTANEEALSVDGPVATATNGTSVRLQRYTIGAGMGTAAEQYVYEVDAVHSSQSGSTTPQSGLSDLAVLPNGKLLALERSVVYDDFLGFNVPEFEDRIYEVDFSGAAAVSQPEAGLTAVGQTFLPVGKTLLWSGDFINLEGLALGGATDNGYVLMAITDNQGSGLLTTTLVSWELTGDIEASAVPEPAAWFPAFLALLGLIVYARRSRHARGRTAWPGLQVAPCSVS